MSENGLHKLFVPLPRIKMKENLNINIPTKERITNVDIFLFLFYQKFKKKIQNIVLTAVAE